MAIGATHSLCEYASKILLKTPPQIPTIKRRVRRGCAKIDVAGSTRYRDEMRSTSLIMGLLTLCAGATLGCGVTMSELQAMNPQAKTLQVPCHPWQILEHVKVFALRSSSNDIVTDESQGALRDFAADASVFIEVNPSAPRENVETMASDYGLICRQDLPIRSTPLESLRSKEPCLAEGNAGSNSQYMGDANPQPCNSGANLGSTKAQHNHENHRFNLVCGTSYSWWRRRYLGPNPVRPRRCQDRKIRIRKRWSRG